MTPASPQSRRRLLRDAEITVAPFDAALAERALDAWRRFGHGRHHAAR